MYFKPVNGQWATLPSTIQIHEHLEAKNNLIIADPTQVQQVLMNLCTNAKQAMRKEGGQLEVSLTDALMESEADAKARGLSPDHYLKLTVSDTGVVYRVILWIKFLTPILLPKKKAKEPG